MSLLHPCRTWRTSPQSHHGKLAKRTDDEQRKVRISNFLKSASTTAKRTRRRSRTGHLAESRQAPPPPTHAQLRLLVAAVGVVRTAEALGKFSGLPNYGWRLLDAIVDPIA